VGEWGNCTTGNDTDCTQYQFRNVFCEQVLANNLPSLVAADQCHADLGEPPVAVKICDEVIADEFLSEDIGGGDPSSPRFHIGPWTGCSVICGDGIRTREVTCFKKNEDGEVEILEAAECSAARPAVEEPCSNAEPCTPVDWIITDVTGCEGTCGLTHRSMHAICSDAEGTAVTPAEEGRCSAAELPELVEPCEDLQLQVPVPRGTVQFSAGDAGGTRRFQKTRFADFLSLCRTRGFFTYTVFWCHF
jgi:hypothetical protein